ncbi:MAG: diadenylate cyclase CdaA [Verrucomicrobia bacterium]|nr:diadenylate cyclase CdaA [Verrucomicrobiota bacterium]
MWDGWTWPEFGTLLQIAVLAIGYYYVFLFIHGTRGAQVLVGFALMLAVVIGLTSVFNLDALNWLLRRLLVFMGLALLVIFQPEIRRALAELGRQPVFTASQDRRTAVDQIVQAVSILSEQRIGALIAIERDIGTRSVIETGTKLDATVVPELLASLFYPHTPLHDGGVIIRGNRIVAASCVFPLSHNMELHKQLGTRHRAAVGLSEETDAVVIAVSEETGTISVAYRGRLSRGQDRDRLKRFLNALLVRGGAANSPWRRAKEHLDLTPEGIAKSDEMAKQESLHAS